MLAWSGQNLPLTARGREAWERASQDIEANRCGEMLLRVIDANGQPRQRVPIRYQQQKHAFLFGVQYPYHAETYDLLQAAGINAATLWLGWKYVQPERGVFNWEYLDKVWDPAALFSRGLHLTAHALNWFKPDWHVLPHYLRESPLSELPQLVYEHVGEIARHWAPYIGTYEIVNEPFWVDAHALPLQLEDMVRICRAAALAVRDVVPNARLEINFAEASRLRSYHIRPGDLLEALSQANVPYDSIGIQALENTYTVTEPPTFYRTKSLYGMIRTLRTYASFGKDLRLSALTAPSQPAALEPPGWFVLPYGRWNESLQADYLDAAYTLFFAQREVQGITWWSPVDGRLALVPGGGLLREDRSPKPSYQALQNWAQRYSSSGQVHTDAEGKAMFRGYAGDYGIIVGVGDLGKSMTCTIRAGALSEVVVVLSDTPWILGGDA